MRARTNTTEMRELVMRDLSTLRQHMPTDGPADSAMTGLETFVAVALRVLAKTNPSKVASEARTVEIAYRMAKGAPQDGQPT